MVMPEIMAIISSLQFACLLATACLIGSTEGGDVEARLLSRILMEYSSLISPTQGTGPLRVGLAISLKNIGQVDEKAGTVHVGFWLHQNWTDASVTWDLATFNISSIFIPRRLIWVPDTVIRNGANVRENMSRDITLYTSGEIADARLLEADLPCVRRKVTRSSSAPSGDDYDSDDTKGGQPEGKSSLTCSLVLGCWIEPDSHMMYEPGVANINSLHQSYSAAWKLLHVHSYSTTEQSPRPLQPSSVIVFDITLVDEATDNPPLQLVAPSILTSLVAIGVFFLPPLAGERIVMVGVAFTGQLLLAGFSVLMQAESNSSKKLYQLMLFSTVYVFLVIVAVLASFFAYPLMKRFEKLAEETGEEDNAQLITVADKKLVSAVPDAILFVIFLILLGIGMTAIFT